MTFPPLDPLLPGFHQTWDPARMLGVFDQIIEREPGWAIDAVELDKIRHRPGTRGIVQYRADLVRGSQRRELWLAGSTYADGRNQALADKLARSQIVSVPPLRRLSSYDRFHDMVWQVFPLDRRLPGLAPAWSHWRNRGRGALWIRPIRHRLGLNATVRIDDHGLGRYVKFYPEGKALEAMSRSNRLALLGAPHLFPKPSHYSGAWEATITEETTGVSLDAFPAPTNGQLALVAESLRVLHRREPGGLTFAGSQPARRARAAADWLALVFPQASKSVSLLLASDWPSGGDEPVHGDLKPEHVLVAGEEARFIDLDSSGRGRGLSDAASLFVRLSDREGAAFFRDQYIGMSPTTRFGPPTIWLAEVAMASLHLALFHARHRRSGWQEEVVAVLDRALSQRPLE